MTNNDAYNVVTERIIEALEAGIVPWHRPWKSALAGGGPLSLATGKPYRGVNVFILGVTAAMRGYESPYWLTFKQAKTRGGTVRKGEKGTQVVLWKPVKRDEEKGARDDKPSSYLLLRYYTVFNADQCDGLKLPAVEEVPEHDPVEAADVIAEQYRSTVGPRVSHGGDRAYYSPNLDYVQMPVQGAFDTAESYYGVLFHELAHSTGHESRLKRDGIAAVSPFGTESYAQEELVAEMAAAFLCGEAGIEPNVPQHTAYIASWLRRLKDDRKLVVQAAGQAQRAADLIVGRSFKKEEEGDKPSP
jgi:antirestriction protein ArdC